MMLIDELKALDFEQINKEVKRECLTRIAEGKLTIQEDPYSHFGVYTLPYHPLSKKILIGHHIKADKWLAPGGHIDDDETIKQTAVREINEELRLQVTKTDISEPFFADIANIVSKPPRLCTMHYTIWVYFLSPINTIILDPGEFYESRWVRLEEASELTTDPANKDAFKKFAKVISIPSPTRRRSG